MAKLKTNSGAKKRFTLTGSGKIKRKHAYHSHILTKKTKKRRGSMLTTATSSPRRPRSAREILTTSRSSTK